MSERLEDAFDPEIEVVTFGDRVVAVLYDGNPLAFNQNEVESHTANGWISLYENGDGRDVLLVEVEDD